MTNDRTKNESAELGYLTVRVSTARGAVPLSGAAVNVRGADVDDSEVIYALTTNSDGLTPTVPLPAPPRSDSTRPQTQAPPYAVYNVDVFAKGYSPVFFHNVPVFSGVTSVQPAVLVPFLEGSLYDTSRHVNETGGEPLL